MDFWDYETLQPYFAYEAMFKDPFTAQASETALEDAAPSNALVNAESSPQENPNALLPPMEGDPNV